MTEDRNIWTAKVLTLFPEMFPGPLAHSLAGKALADEAWSLETVDIRDYATDDTEPWTTPRSVAVPAW